MMNCGSIPSTMMQAGIESYSGWNICAPSKLCSGLDHLHPHQPSFEKVESDNCLPPKLPQFVKSQAHIDVQTVPTIVLVSPFEVPDVSGVCEGGMHRNEQGRRTGFEREVGCSAHMRPSWSGKHASASVAWQRSRVHQDKDQGRG